MRNITNLIAFLSVFCGQMVSAGEGYYFYNPKLIGSESSYNPMRMMINNSYGILSASGRNNDITDIDYSTGFSNVWDNVSRPFHHIGIYGWSNILKDEFIPASVELKNGQWWPNYTNHLIGGGMMYRKTAEWYLANNLPHPFVLAYLNIMGMHYLNEVVENRSFSGTNVDPLVDLLIFDQLGILLFSNNAVLKIFSEKLNMSDWSLQPSLNPSNGFLENAAQNYMIRFPLPRMEDNYIFYHWGNNGIIGISRLLKNNQQLSVGGGLTLKDVVEVGLPGEPRKATTSLVWTAGIFYDVEGSLLASFILSGTKRYRMLLNVYPGVINGGSFSPGFFAAMSKNNDLIAGISLSFFPLGLSSKL